MSLDEQFQDALEQVKAVASPTPQVLLSLYGLFKQSTVGDVTSDRPGMLDMRGRAKYDAWASRKGMSSDEAKEEYVEYVAELLG